MYQLIDVSPNDTKDAVLGAEKDYVLTFDGSFWRGMPNKGGLSSKLFTALDKEGNEVNPDDENAEIYAIRANYSLWSVGFLSAKGISDGGTGGGGGGAVALYQLLDVEKNADITGVAGATKGSVLTFNGDKWYADKPKTAAGISNLFTALDNDGNEVDLNDESKLGTITNIRANYALWSVDWISAKGKSSGGSGGGGGIKNIAQSGSGNAITDMTLSSDGKTITAVFGETFARQQDLGTLNNTVTQLSNKLNNFLEGLTGNDTLTELLALKADKTITISAGTGLTGGGNLSANRTLSLATTGVKAGTYTKVTVDTYGRVTVGDNPTTLAGYGITDAYTKTEADGKYVTIATPQTITGQKTFTKNIAMNSGIGLSYSGNTVFRNTSGNTVISSYGDSGMLYFRPNGDTSDVGVVQINKQGHINGVSAGFKGGVSAARLSATEYVQIGDAYLKWDAANNAVYVIKKDGTTPVGFYSTDWLSAKGVSMSGAQTGTLDSLNDVEITDPVNGQALKYDAASKKWVNGTIDSFNVNQMWAELKKADSSKVIDASHIPTSVLDGRWVKKAGDTMTGTLTSASSSGSIVFKGVENCDITNIYKDNGVIRNGDGGLTSIRNGLRFNWYDTYWYIGNIRGGGTESAGFGVVDHNNKLVLRVTPNDVRAPRFMSTVATGLSPLIVSSNTTVDNLSADLLDGYHAFGTSNALIKYGYTVGGTEPAWCRIATYSIRNTETMTDVCFVLHSSFSDLFGLLVVKTRGTAVVEGLLIASYNINRSNIRIYHDAEKKNIELYCYGGSNYSIIQANLLYSHDRNGGANTNITLYQADTKAPSWSTYVNPVFANLQNSSEAAKKLQTPRTLWGQSFDGTANVSGDMTGVGSITMTGDLTMNNTKGFNIGWSTRVVKDSGVWIHGGSDAASSADANLRFGSWYGIGWYPTFSGGSVAQGNNAMWLDVRNGNLDTHGAITAHTNYLAANWDSARRLVLGGGSSYAYIDSRNSSNNVLCNIVLEDNKVFIGNYAESSRFVSTVGTGTAPYQCSSTTLNTNLNADLLDNWHIMDIPRNYNSTATYSLQFALGGTDNNWKKIFACSESGAGPYRSVTVWGRIWYAYGNHAQDEVRSYHFCAIFQMRSGPSASDSNVGDISNSARLYLPTFAKGMDNIRLVRVGTNNFELQVRQIGSYNNGYIQYQYWANGANVSAWRGLQSTSNTSVAVSAGGASTLADSRASSADVWTTARTFYIQDYHSANTGAGVSVNGGSNCYLKLPSTTRFSRIDFSTPNANIRHSGNDNGNEVGSSTLSNLVIDSWYGVSFTTTCSSTYQNKIAMSVNCRTGRVTANNFHAATNITANGAITAKASSSDIRLKTDIQGYDAMGIIRKFRSVKYHWNAIAKENSEVFNHDNWNYGLIAQDLLSGGYSQWVKDAFNDYYTIDYERLIPVVWKGLQEVDDEVTKLKREVARLNKRVKELEKSLCA